MILRTLCRIFFACAIVVLLSQTLVSNASATDINGWTNQGSAGTFDLYFQPNGVVDYTALCELVNYQDTVITLKVISANGTTSFTQAVNPHSSMFIPLSFPNLGTYKLEIISGSYTLLTLTENHPSVVPIIPTNLNQWHIAPPTTNTTGPNQYTQTFVDNLISMLTIEVLLEATMAAVIGLLLGALVKRTTLFFAPNDILSFTFFAFVGTDLIFNWTKFGVGIFYLPVIAGYFLGFFIAHFAWVLGEKTDIGGMSRSKHPYVIYSPNDEIGNCIQQQSNKALIKRWLGYHHRLGMDGPLVPNLADSAKYPYFPKFRKQVLKIEEEATTYHDEPFFFGLLNVRVYKTYWYLSNVCTYPKDRWLDSCATILWLQDMNKRLTSDLTKERQRHVTDATHVASDMIANSMDRSTHRAVYETFNKPLPPRTIPQPTENVISQEMERVARPQKSPEDVEPERTEKKSKRNNEIENEAEPAMDREDDENEEDKKTRKSRRN